MTGDVFVAMKEGKRFVRSSSLHLVAVLIVPSRPFERYSRFGFRHPWWTLMANLASSTDVQADHNTNLLYPHLRGTHQIAQSQDKRSVKVSIIILGKKTISFNKRGSLNC